MYKNIFKLSMVALLATQTVSPFMGFNKKTTSSFSGYKKIATDALNKVSGSISTTASKAAAKVTTTAVQHPTKAIALGVATVGATGYYFRNGIKKAANSRLVKETAKMTAALGGITAATYGSFKALPTVQTYGKKVAGIAQTYGKTATKAAQKVVTAHPRISKGAAIAAGVVTTGVIAKSAYNGYKLFKAQKEDRKNADLQDLAKNAQEQYSQIEPSINKARNEARLEAQKAAPQHIAPMQNPVVVAKSAPKKAVKKTAKRKAVKRSVKRKPASKRTVKLARRK